MVGKRLYTLDGIRGLAAICVVFFHLDRIGIEFARSGYLAVDFFFALSGLVLAIAYQDKLNQHRLSATQFLISRVIRLYPMYAVGAALGIIAAVLAIKTGPFALPGGALWYPHILMGMLMLPDVWSHFELYPLDPPAWSLMFELLVNALFAVLLVRLRDRWLMLIWVASLALYLFKVDHAWARAPGANLGPYWDHFVAGMLRVTCSFTFGVLLMRIGAWRHRRISLLAVVPVIALMIVFLAPPTLVMDILAVGLLIPATVWMASRTELPVRFRPGCEWLGDISYPLYATHFPVLFLVDYAAKRLGVSPLIEIATFLVVAVGAASALISVDKKVGTHLSALFQRLVARHRLAPKTSHI